MAIMVRRMAAGKQASRHGVGAVAERLSTGRKQREITENAMGSQKRERGGYHEGILDQVKTEPHHGKLQTL